MNRYYLLVKLELNNSSNSNKSITDYSNESITN